MALFLFFIIIFFLQNLLQWDKRGKQYYNNNAQSFQSGKAHLKYSVFSETLCPCFLGLITRSASQFPVFFFCFLRASTLVDLLSSTVYPRENHIHVSIDQCTGLRKKKKKKNNMITCITGADPGNGRCVYLLQALMAICCWARERASSKMIYRVVHYIYPVMRWWGRWFLSSSIHAITAITIQPSMRASVQYATPHRLLVFLSDGGSIYQWWSFRW